MSNRRSLSALAVPIVSMLVLATVSFTVSLPALRQDRQIRSIEQTGVPRVVAACMVHLGFPRGMCELGIHTGFHPRALDPDLAPSRAAVRAIRAAGGRWTASRDGSGVCAELPGTPPHCAADVQTAMERSGYRPPSALPSQDPPPN